MPRIIKDRLEILSKTPSWFTRSGSSVLLIIVLLILFGTYLIKYPDTVDATATITTTQLPTPIKARQNGYLEKLTGTESQGVKKGDIVGVIESTTNFEKALFFSESLERLKKQINLDQFDSFPTIDSLGVISKSYNSVLSSFTQVQRHLSNPLFEIQRGKKRIEMDRTQELVRRSSAQLVSISREQIINKNRYKRDSALYAQNVLSLQQFEDSKKTYSSQLQKVYDLESEIQINHETLRSLELQLKEINVQKTEDTKNLKLALIQSIEIAEADLLQWDRNYVLRAPIKGELSFFKLLDENQYINAGDELMIVLPREEKLFAVCQASLIGAGKIKEGQEVQIRLNSFPYMEYGFIQGKVQSISQVSREDSYMVKVELPNGLVTNYDQGLNFTQEMRGQAIIITEDLRLIHRFFNQFRSWFEK